MRRLSALLAFLLVFSAPALAYTPGPNVYFSSQAGTTEAGLLAADAYCAAKAITCVLDANYTTTADRTLAANWDVVGGKITHSTHALAFSGSFWAGNDAVFDAAATGVVSFNGGLATGAILEKWFGVARDGSTIDTQAYKNALAACGNRTLIEGSGTSIRSGWNSTVNPPANCTLSGRGPGSTIDSYSGTGSYIATHTQTNANFTVQNLTVKISGPSASGMEFVYWEADHLHFYNVECDGTMTDNGTSLTSGISVCVQPGPSGTQTDFQWIGGKAHNAYSAYGKNNSWTSVQRFVRFSDLDFGYNYGGDIQLNSPNGSQSDVVVTRNNHHDPIYLSGFAGQLAGVAVAFGDGVRIISERFSGNYYDAIHLEGNLTNLQVIGNVGTVTTDGVSVLASNLDSGGTWYNAVGCEIANNVFTQSGTPQSPLHAGFPNFGIGFNMQNSGHQGPENCSIHDNVFQGSGFGAGLAIDNDYFPGTQVNTVSRNQFIATAIGEYFVNNAAVGGISFNENVCNATPVCIKGWVVHIASQTFVGMDPAMLTAVPFVGINASNNHLSVDNAHFEFVGVSLATSASQNYCLLRLGSNDRLGGSVSLTGYTQAQRQAGSFYNGIGWDGTTYTAGTALGTQSGFNMTTALSKATIGSIPCLEATTTNSIGSTQTFYLSADIKGFYDYYGN